jgi:hypothetical protein
MNNWYLVKTRYTKEFPDGTLKRVTVQYLLQAVSFTDAEKRTHEEVGSTVRGEFQVTDIKKKVFADIFYLEDVISNHWFEFKVSIDSVDSDTGREKKITHKFLIKADTIEHGIERIKECLKGYFYKFFFESVSKTKIEDIFIGNGYQDSMDFEEE